MNKLLEIARDYREVRNYVYTRYGGIGSLSKIYPGYTVQNEMTAGGLADHSRTGGNCSPCSDFLFLKNQSGPPLHISSSTLQACFFVSLS